MVRPSRHVPLPPVSPVQMALISSPPYRPYRPRILATGPAFTRTLILAAARPRYPVPYTALSPNPRELKLVLKLATAPREPGPLHLYRSSQHLNPNPKSPTLSRNIPLSFQKTCSCPISRRCTNWRPCPPMPKYYSPPYQMPRYIPEVPVSRLAKVMAPRAPIDASLLTRPSILETHHALKFRKSTRTTTTVEKRSKY